MTRTTALNTGLDAFLAWAQRERRTVLPPRPADAVLTLLALRGADRRAGVPEPTPGLVRRVLAEDLPLLLWASPDEAAAVPSVLTALADRVRAAGRLNAKRHARVLAAVEEAVPVFMGNHGDLFHLTWARWYASLMRADGVDVDDPGAVSAWLAAFDATPRAQRPRLPGPLHRADLAAATFTARARLADTMLAAFARDVEGPSPAGPLLSAASVLGADRPEDALPSELDALGAGLSDRWTAAGLAEALSGPYAALAPGPEALPHLLLADRLLDEHLNHYGCASAALPPPAALPGPDGIRALLWAAPLPAALAAGNDDVRGLAALCGFPGPAEAVWSDGTPQELVELAADVLAAAVEDAASDTYPAGPVDEEYGLDAAHVLYGLYARGGTPDSVARRASGHTDLVVPRDLEDAPVSVPASAPPEYRTPALAELSAVLGIPGLTEEDRSAVDGPAHALAAVVDELTGTGCVFRTGDAYGLTPLGNAAVRHVFASSRVAAPDEHEFVSWDAVRMVGAVQCWPTAVAATALTRWTTARGATDAVWSELLEAVSAAKSGDFYHTLTAELFSRLDRADIPVGPLRSALEDPVTGAYVHRLLHSRGEPAQLDLVPLSARALLLLEELDICWAADMQSSVAARDRAPEPAPTALIDAFDEAAAGWPGGAASLLPALTDTDPATAVRILEDLRERHPDGRVADLSAHALKTAKATVKRSAAHHHGSGW
ncbi:hypothetical protein SSP531S_04880 [Streptomyces spongiicola]|uniref:Uncharacterized protein n=1 Tax=Streptomyces spongiicola TaxID=1690221 RepID=A0A2S1Z6P5_9ACTN|nr:hypothetical protein [Streptomyces spongiicola]AWK12011.1 hypothetical protein DDQ41_27270 [Streptomyces spongiicola]GBP99093.1 hypothetical protein SSP531S_04880 [Streptomyces spongiicola]